MRIILLSPYPERIVDPIIDGGDEWAPPDWLPLLYNQSPSCQPEVDWIVSYGYRHIIKNTSALPPIVNLHISYLPWNRGADPNYWSWREGTPKGVTIHKIDDGIDTGPIYAQEETVFKGATLAETYEELHAHICDLFARVWPSIRNGTLQPKPQEGRGTYHRSTNRPAVDWNQSVTDLDRLHGCGYNPRNQ